MACSYVETGNSNSENKAVISVDSLFSVNKEFLLGKPLVQGTEEHFEAWTMLLGGFFVHHDNIYLNREGTGLYYIFNTKGKLIDSIMINCEYKQRTIWGAGIINNENLIMEYAGNGGAVFCIFNIKKNKCFCKDEIWSILLNVEHSDYFIYNKSDTLVSSDQKYKIKTKGAGHIAFFITKEDVDYYRFEQDNLIKISHPLLKKTIPTEERWKISPKLSNTFIHPVNKNNIILYNVEGIWSVFLQKNKYKDKEVSIEITSTTLPEFYNLNEKCYMFIQDGDNVYVYQIKFEE